MQKRQAGRTEQQRIACLYLCNASKLVAATVLALTYQIPPSPPDHAEDWIPLLEQGVSIAAVDYLDFNASAYNALVLDPALVLDNPLALTLIQNTLPILALGQSGAHLLEILAGVETTTVGTQVAPVSAFTG